MEKNIKKNNDYDNFGHQKYKIRYHIIFSTKYRKKLLVGLVSDIIKSYMHKVESKQKNWSIEMMEIDQSKPDHIHLLIKSSPSVMPYNIIHDLKQMSTYLMWKEHYGYMCKFYKPKNHYLWTRGYFCSSIGDACTKTILEYIKNQG